MADVVIDEVAIDIVPELKNFLADMRRQAIPAAERVGREIGAVIGRQISKAVNDAVDDGLRRAKAKAAAQKLTIKADLDTSEAERKLAKLQRSADKIRIGVGVDVADADAKLNALRARQEAAPIRLTTITAGVGASAPTRPATNAASSAIQRARTPEQGRTFDAITVPVRPNLDRFLPELRQQALPAASQVGRDVGERMGTQIATRLSHVVGDVIEGEIVDVDVDVDTAAAKGKLLELRRSGGTVHFDADVDTARAVSGAEAFWRFVDRGNSHHALGAGSSGGGGGGFGGGGGGPGGFGGGGGGFGGGGGGGTAAGGVNQLAGAAGGATSAMQGLIAVGISLAPLIVPAAAVAAAAIVAIGAAASVAGAAVATIGLGFSGIGDAYSALTAQSKQAGTSAGGLANKQGQIQSALERVGSAERALANIRADAADAAIRNAQRIADAGRKVVESQAAELAAQTALTEARKRAKEDIEDLALSTEAAATAEERAALTLRKAKANLEKTSLDESKTDDERLDAKLAVDEAVQGLQRQQLETQRLNAQKAESDRAGVEGSKLVLDAQAGVRNAAQGVVDALRDQADVGREVAAQQRQEASSLVEANLSLVQAQRSYQEALHQTGGAGAAAANKVAQAMKELSPAGREFVNFLFTEMKPALDGLKATAQESLLPGVEQALKNLKPLLPQINTLIGAFGQALGQVAIQIVAALNGPSFRKFLDYLIKEGPKILGYLTTIGLSLLDVFTTMIVAFGPSTDQILGGIAAFAAGFAQWFATFVQSDEFKQFMQYLIDNGPQIAALLLEIALIVIKLAIALGPLGAILLEGLVEILGWLASLSPNEVLAVFLVLGVLIGILAIAIGAPVVAIAALVIAIVALFALIVNVLPAIGRFFVSMWEDYIKPALSALWRFLNETLPNAVNSFLAWVGSGIVSAGSALQGWITGLLSWIGGLGNRLASAGAGMWNWIKDSFKGALNAIIGWWNRLSFSIPAVTWGDKTLFPGFTLNTPDIGYFARGGVVPGYSPGVDDHLAAVSGGEAIMRPEWTKAVGPGYVHAANAAARSGGVSGVRGMGLPRFATGGIYQPGGMQITASVGNGTPTGGATQPLVGAIHLHGAKSSTRQDAQMVADELGWQARLGTGRG